MKQLFQFTYLEILRTVSKIFFLLRISSSTILNDELYQQNHLNIKFSN